MGRLLSIVALLSAISCSGCLSPRPHGSGAEERRMTAGLVQMKIRQGMPQSEVAEALGSPNIVTKDVDGNQAWVYDKIATEASYSHETSDAQAVGGVGRALPQVLTIFFGRVSGGHSRTAGRSSVSQRTLTVVIKFDSNGVVSGFSYHTSRF